MKKVYTKEDIADILLTIVEDIKLCISPRTTMEGAWCNEGLKHAIDIIYSDKLDELLDDILLEKLRKERKDDKD